MNPEIQLLVTVWESVKNYIQKKDRVEAAEHLVRVMDEECDMSGIEEEALTLLIQLITMKRNYKKPNTNAV